MTRLADNVALCKTWKQLHHAALTADEANEPRDKGVYYSGLRFCSAERLNSRIHDVRAGGSINRITRNHGLRAKVVELLAA
jgi:hypothetical protein